MCFYNDYMQQSKSSLSLLFFKLKQQQINKLGKSMWFDVTVIDYHYTCYQIVCRGKNGNSVTFFWGGGIDQTSLNYINYELNGVDYTSCE